MTLRYGKKALFGAHVVTHQRVCMTMNDAGGGYQPGRCLSVRPSVRYDVFTIYCQYLRDIVGVPSCKTETKTDPKLACDFVLSRCTHQQNRRKQIDATLMSPLIARNERIGFLLLVTD